MADSFARLLRTLFMLALGVFVVGLALFLLMFTLTLMLLRRLWGVLTGRPSTAGDGWVQFQQSAASTVWRTYRQGAGRPGKAPDAAPARDEVVDVVDVDFREVSARSRGETEDSKRIER